MNTKPDIICLYLRKYPACLSIAEDLSYFTWKEQASYQIELELDQTDAIFVRNF